MFVYNKAMNNSTFPIGWILLLCLVLALAVFAYIRLAQYRKRKKEEAHQKWLAGRVEELTAGQDAVTPEEFFALREMSFGNPDLPLYESGQDFQGVYVLFNEDKNKYYVGQGIRVLSRVNNHFSGRGNGDVYADYRYLDHFTIRIIPLAGSGFDSLNELERYTIEYYDAFANGYNKTRGNQD